MVLNFELSFYMHGDIDEASPYENSEVNLEAQNNSYMFSKKSQKLAEIFGLMEEYSFFFGPNLGPELKALARDFRLLYGNFAMMFNSN